MYDVSGPRLGQLRFRLSICLEGFYWSADEVFMFAVVEETLLTVVLDARSGSSVASWPTPVAQPFVHRYFGVAMGCNPSQILVKCPANRGLLFRTLQW